MNFEFQTLTEGVVDLGIGKNSDLVKLELENEKNLSNKNVIKENDLKLFVEEDTGELLLKTSTQENSVQFLFQLKNHTKSPIQPASTKSNIRLNYHGRCIFDPLPDQILRPPCRLHSSINSSFHMRKVSANETTTNLESNKSDSSNVVSLCLFNSKRSIQTDQPVLLTNSNSQLNSNNVANTSNQSNVLLDDISFFGDEFIKEFEDNLERYDINELINSNETCQSLNNQMTDFNLDINEPKNEIESSIFDQINDIVKIVENIENETTSHSISNVPESSSSFQIDLNSNSIFNKLCTSFSFSKESDYEEIIYSKRQDLKDQMLLKENKISVPLKIVVESSVDEFNELIKVLELTNEQLTVIKEIRRRGKNKIAAQMCRKRKIDSFESLKEEIEILSKIKLSLDSEHDLIIEKINEFTNKFDDLYKELIEESDETNHDMVSYINDLKGQVKSQNETSKMLRNTLQKSLSVDHSVSDTNSDEYDEENIESSFLFNFESDSFKTFKKLKIC